MSKFLVVGGNGRVGRELVRLLLDGGHEVRAMVRGEARVPVLQHDGVELVRGDIADAAAVTAACDGIGKVYLATSDDDESVAAAQAFFNAAAAAGVQHVVRLSARSADPDSPSVLSRRHGERERALEASGMAWTHLRPTWFMQMMLEYMPGGTLEIPGGEGRIAWIDTRDIAAVAAAALTEEGHAGRTYEMTGPEALTYGDLTRTMSEATGRSFVYRAISPEAFRERELAAGESEWYVELLLQLYERIRDQTMAEVAPGVEQALGRKPIDFATFARDYADELVEQL